MDEALGGKVNDRILIESTIDALQVILEAKAPMSYPKDIFYKLLASSQVIDKIRKISIEMPSLYDSAEDFENKWLTMTEVYGDTEVLMDADYVASTDQLDDNNDDDQEVELEIVGAPFKLEIAAQNPTG